MLTRAELMNELTYNEKTGLFWWASRKQGRQMDRPAGNMTTEGYVEIRQQGKHYFAHRLAWLFIYEVWPEDELDHVDRIRHHNWITNLREATRFTNAQNQSPHFDKNSNLPMGIDMQNGKFRVRLQVNGVRRELGGLQKLESAIVFLTKWKQEML